MQQDFGLKKLLHIFAIIVFVICLALAIYYGVVAGKVIETIVSELTGETTYKEGFNFGLFLIEFIRWIASGLFGSGVLLGLAERCL